MEPDSSLAAPERETIINMDDATDVVSIWTSQRKVITRLRRLGLDEIESGFYGKTPWAKFAAPADRFTFGLKRSISAETRAAMAQRATETGFGQKMRVVSDENEQAEAV